jgi:protein-S-isoprenylcysteine O-methyltransferase Ste14
MTGRNIVLTLIVGAAFALAVWQHQPAEWRPMPIAGLCLLIIGFVLWSMARFQLGASFAVTAQARSLVTHGFYSKIRNPIYVFGSWVIIGFILLLEKPLGLLVFLLLVPLQLWRARKEASVWEAKFGEEYRKYRASTWF